MNQDQEILSEVGMKVISPPKWTSVFGKELGMKRGLQNGRKQLVKASEAIIAGFCNTEIYRDVGVSPPTLRKLRRVLALNGVKPRCICGRPAAHWAYCIERKERVEREKRTL